MYELKIKFPPDFEGRYDAYKAKILKSEASVIQKPIVDDAKKFPHKLPSGTKWENFVIQFLTDDEVSIVVVGKNEKLDYKAMGFKDKRNTRPNSQWAFFLLLAKRGGEISWDNSEADDKFKKSKERLTTQLQDYFSIDYDPFHPYQETKSYRIKLTLMPPPNDKENIKNKGDGLADEIQEMFDGLTE